MSTLPDRAFHQHRTDTFDRVIALLDAHLAAAAPSLLAQFNELSPASMAASAEKEAWTLLRRGIRHLRDGAPGGQPGSMTEALSRASLRAGSFAAALGVKPPQFEQMLFEVDYGSGGEAALFFCRRLVEAAEGDLAKSRQLIQQKLLHENPGETSGTGLRDDDAAAFKRQMVFSFNMMAEAYARVCHTLKGELKTLQPPPPPAAPPAPGRSFEL